MIRRARAFLLSQLRNPAFRRAAGFDGPPRFGPLNDGILRLVLVLSIPPLAVLSVRGIELAKFHPYSIMFAVLATVVVPALLLLGIAEMVRLVLVARGNSIADQPESNGASAPDITGHLFGSAFHGFVAVVSVQICVVIIYWMAEQRAAASWEGFIFSYAMYAMAILLPLTIELPLRARRMRFGIRFFARIPGANGLSLPAVRLLNLPATLAIVLAIVIGLYESHVLSTSWYRPSTLDTVCVSCLCLAFSALQYSRCYLLIAAASGLLAAASEPTDETAPQDMHVIEIPSPTLKEFLNSLRENPIFLRAAGFMYIRRIGRWPEGLARIAIILGMIPLVLLLTALVAREYRVTFEAQVFVITLLTCPVLFGASLIDTSKAVRGTLGKRVDGPLALTKLTFADIAIGRCVGSAIFSILSAMMLTLIGVLFLIYWVVFYRKPDSYAVILSMIVGFIVWAPFIPELAIRIIRRVVVGSRSPWRSGIYMATMPLQYLLFALLSYHLEQLILLENWDRNSILSFVDYVESTDNALIIMAPLLIYFCLWRWNICWMLILSAGAAMEANMRAWWESGEHD